MMKTNFKRRLAVAMSLALTSLSVMPSMANAITDETGNTNVTATETVSISTKSLSASEQSFYSSTDKEFTHSFRVGSQGYSFTAYSKPTDGNGEAQETDNPKLTDYIVIKQTEANVKDLDLEKVFRCNVGQAYEWTYDGMTFTESDVQIQDITEDFSIDILSAIVHLKTFTEDEVLAHDVNKDGKINVVDVVFANQIRSAYPMNFLDSSISIQKLMVEIIPLVQAYDSVKVYIDEDEIFCDCYGDPNSIMTKDPDGMYISHDDYRRLAFGAFYYGIKNYRIVYSEEPVMYAYGYEAEVSRPTMYQILPASYQKKLMSEDEYKMRSEANADDISFIFFGQWFGALGCDFGHSLLHYEVKNGEDIGLANWYLIPVDEQGNDIKQCAAGSQFLIDYIASDDLHNPPIFDENGNEIVEVPAEVSANSVVSANSISALIEKLFAKITLFNFFK